ncbi:MAG: 23S rRNA (adenine(2503)-C(2))-methyltransferase RlmN [Lachnospiraceae bacterium]|nr:23S rRNA (adenine(2503)-C(2))-methyltransferase RlmN [Lachnospiraceae bacterium]
MTDIKSLNRTELTDFILELGEKKYRAEQLFSWMHRSLAESPDEMNNIPASLKALIKEKAEYTSLKAVDVQTSAADGTKKFLFALNDGNVIESVWMEYRDWDSVCISSQVGCSMGCVFCASTLDGCVRSLTPSEMLDQVYSIQRITGKRVSNIVVMGSGEPLNNYDNLLKFLEIINDEKGLNIGERHITVSTCGLVPEIRRLADEKKQITLAISLHAPNDEKRRELMPIARKYSLKELLSAVKYYFEKTGRRITFEYALTRGVNDGKEDAKELSELIRDINCHVNLIPVNPVRERSLKPSADGRVNAFKTELEKNGINVTIRREMGRDIDGACGQLRRKHLEAVSNV